MVILKDTLCTGVSSGENQQPYADLLGNLVGREAVLFDPNKYFTESEIGHLSDEAGKLPGMTYDVMAYALSEKVREIVDGHYDGMIKKHDPFIQHGHSLGSIIAMNRASRGFKVPFLITYGSPIFYPFLWNFIDLNQVKKNVKTWINYYSITDWIACGGGKLNKYCRFNRMTVNGHELDLYFKSVVKKWQNDAWLTHPDKFKEVNP